MKKAHPVSASPAVPHFVHDCEACKFLARLNGEDLYHCEKDDAFIRRFGDLPADNGAMGADLAWGGYVPGTPYAFAALVQARQLPALEWEAREENPHG
jgi:hypothetical protein